MNFATFSFPTPTLYGAGALGELSKRMQRLGFSSPLIVMDGGKRRYLEQI